MRFRVIMAVGAAVWVCTWASSAAPAAQSCDPHNDCMMNATCQLDGTCAGTPKPNGSACDPSSLAGDCATTGTCFTFGATSVCMPTNPKPDGTTCTNSIFSSLGQCLTGTPMCQSGFCQVMPKTCSQPSDKCQFAFCDPSDGQCKTQANTCQDACSTGGTCDPGTGNCINQQPANEGQSCSAPGACPLVCHNGSCGAGGAVTPGTATPTATPRPPTPVPTTPSGGNVCPGDCNGNQKVAVNEIIILVNIILGNAQASACANGIPAGASVNVSLVIKAVNADLNGCPTPAAGTNTPTPVAGQSQSPTPQGPTATPTSTPVGVPTSAGFTAARVTGGTQTTIKAFLTIPDLLSALLGHLLPMTPMSPVSGSAAQQIPPVPFTCPGGGGGTLACDQQLVGFSLGPPTYDVTLTNCVVTDSFGTSRTFNGTISAMGQQGDICFLSFPTSPAVTIPNLSVATAGSGGTTTTTFTNFTAAASFSCSGTCQCTYDTFDLTVGGMVAVTSQDTMGHTISSTQANINAGTQLNLSVSDFGNQCVPTVYTLIVNGSAALTTDGQSFSGSFTNYELDDDTSTGDDIVTVNGDVSSTCLGPTASVSTNTDLDIPPGGTCPIAGELEIINQGTNEDDIVDYTGGGAVAIDLNNDATVDFSYTSCLNPQFLVCPVGP